MLKSQKKYKLEDSWTSDKVFPDAEFPLAIIYDNRSVEIDFHNHDFMELVYVTKGTGIHHIKKEGAEEYRYPVMMGDLFVVDGSEHHRYSGEHDLAILNIIFRQSLLDDEMKRLSKVKGLFEFLVVEPMFRVESGFRNKLRLYANDKSVVERLIRQMRAELKNKKNGYESVARALFIELLVIIGRAYSNELENRPELFDMAGKKSAVENAITYIHDNFAQIKSLSTISENVFLSPNYFCTLFSITTGLSPWEYLTKIRLEEAKKLLIVSDRKVSDIAITVGFSNDSYFSKVFQQYFKMPPNAFRKVFG
jgi:AraC-like DNA-binding protein/quercetin dioxygenase-like cupin family protein